MKKIEEVPLPTEATKEEPEETPEEEEQEEVDDMAINVYEEEDDE